jgi:outer membrane protein OmpA-like peptidoglycan-associated protein
MSKAPPALVEKRNSCYISKTRGTGQQSMLRYVIAAGLLLLAGCDMHAGRQVAAACASTSYDARSSGYRSPGYCYDSTDRTPRTHDDLTDRTRRVPEDLRDITQRRNRDDLTDRTVWCEAVGAVITAPSFMVFFDWDKSNLDGEALATIQRAADAYRTKGGAQLTATGHTDTTGPDNYNLALSLRRANAVRDQLIQDGVRPEDISVVGRGKAQPLVRTGDNVRERQNRRVEIVFR